MKKQLAGIILVLMAGSLLCSAQQIPGEKGSGKREGELKERMLKQFDKDGDGKLSETENATMKKIMQERKARADLDGDGTVSEAERKTAHDEMLKCLDTDGDGKVSKEEQEAPRPGKGGPRLDTK